MTLVISYAYACAYYILTYCIVSVAQAHPAVRRLMEMGFPEDACRTALLEAKGNEEAAIEALLSGL
jgi:UBA/TS-N domain